MKIITNPNSRASLLILIGLTLAFFSAITAPLSPAAQTLTDTPTPVQISPTPEPIAASASTNGIALLGIAIVVIIVLAIYIHRPRVSAAPKVSQ
jgi:hypothetical protein